MSKKNILLSHLILLSILFVSIAQAGNPEPPQQKKMWAQSFLGKKAPAIEVEGWIIGPGNLDGKYILVDIWATWCVPCVQQIPALNKLEHTFKNKNIAFVSICFSDTKERWNKMVKEKEMSGVQLFAADDSISFFEDYYVSGIPRFILIDKEGKIIDANAYKPSNPKLKEQLEELLR